MKKVTKQSKIKAHLLKKKSLTSNEAWELFGETRLSARIFDFKKKLNWEFKNTDITKNDRYGNKTTFRKYTLISTPSTK